MNEPEVGAVDPPALPARFIDKYLVSSSGCWEWQAFKNWGGYGMYWSDGFNWKAHRYSYTILRGPVPDGLVIDHLCRNRACVNPDHLEVVTNEENIRRGDNYSKGARERNKTHCPQGHPYDDNNTLVPKEGSTKQGRKCRECSRERARRYYYDNVRRRG